MVFSCGIKKAGKHLFILSGQSNMFWLNPEESFTPLVNEKLGEENVIVVKHAKSGQPIRRWYRDWKSLEGDDLIAQADIYDTLMVKVIKAVKNEKIATITFVWMQGERDAREKYGGVYEVSLKGLYKQLCNDMGRNDIDFIIGRLSDFDMANEKYAHWTKVRDVQVKVAESNPRFRWVNTDDLNNGLNGDGIEIKDDLHLSVEGYKVLGNRFAEKALQLIESE